MFCPGVFSVTIIEEKFVAQRIPGKAGPDYR